MTLSRIVPWLTAALVTSCVTLWLSANAAPAGAGAPISEARAFSELASVAAAHGHKIPDGLVTYAHFGNTVVAHGPLAGIGGYTEADFKAGVPIMAVLVAEPTPGRVPNGAYVVWVQFDPGSDTGIATYVDRDGHVAASVPAYSRTPDAIRQVFPNVFNPPPPMDIPDITSTHVWYGNHWAVDCSGWVPFHTVYY
jgi:hypothetical protein